MPSQKTIEILRDKSLSYKVWSEAGIKVPVTILINNKSDLKKAYNKFGENIWVRDTVGAAGKGSLSGIPYETALFSIESRNMWGKVTAAQRLTPSTVTWQSIWHKGKLVVAQGRKRLYWAFENRAQSGVTGLTGTGVTVSDKGLDQFAVKCILAADKKPHGIFSVDFTCDKDGVPNPTEINIGKFFTTHHFITRTGCNMPQIFVSLAFEEYDGPFGVLNPCKPDMYWIRGIDVLPVLLHKSDIAAKEDEFRAILEKI
jgi:carbamoyl-phosphate synthase large subunit